MTYLTQTCNIKWGEERKTSRKWRMHRSSKTIRIFKYQRFQQGIRIIFLKNTDTLWRILGLLFKIQKNLFFTTEKKNILNVFFWNSISWTFCSLISSCKTISKVVRLRKFIYALHLYLKISLVFSIDLDYSKKKLYQKLLW